MTMWKMSAAYFDIISFVEGVNMSIKGKIINDQLTSSDVCSSSFNVSLTLSEYKNGYYPS